MTFTATSSACGGDTLDSRLTSDIDGKIRIVRIASNHTDTFQTVCQGPMTQINSANRHPRPYRAGPEITSRHVLFALNQPRPQTDRDRRREHLGECLLLLGSEDMQAVIYPATS